MQANSRGPQLIHYTAKFLINAIAFETKDGSNFQLHTFTIVYLRVLDSDCITLTGQAKMHTVSLTKMKSSFRLRLLPLAAGGVEVGLADGLIDAVEVVEIEAVESEAVESEAVESEAVGSEAVESEVDESEADESEVVVGLGLGMSSQIFIYK